MIQRKRGTLNSELRTLNWSIVLRSAFCVISSAFLFRGAAQADLSSLPTNTWVNVTPPYIGAPHGGNIFPQSWNNKGAFDPTSRRVIVMDRWYDSVHAASIYANALMAYDPNVNVV